MMRALADARPPTGTRGAWDLDPAPVSLSALFAELALLHPGRLAVSDQARRDLWSGRPQVEWTYGWALTMLKRLSSYLESLSLSPGSVVGICLANGSENYLSILAVERAGLTPCLLPLSWSETDLAKAVAGMRMQVVITQGVVGEDKPAEAFGRIQGAVFRLRYIMGFGPDLPRGVVDLDRVLMDAWLVDEAADPLDRPPLPETGIITFGRSQGALQPVFRPTSSLLASAGSILATTRTRAASRIVSLMPPDDHAALATGLASALLAGASLECHGVFGAASLIDSLDDPTPAHLVAPGWMEEALAEFELPPAISPVLIHRPPIRFKPSTALSNGVVDVLAFDEVALLSAARSSRGLFAASMEQGQAEREPRPIRTKIGADDAIFFDGAAAETSLVENGAFSSVRLSGWKPSGFKVERFAGVIIGVA